MPKKPNPKYAHLAPDARAKAFTNDYMSRDNESVRGLIKRLKQESCSRCGNEFPFFCMEFHHRDPATKKFDVSAAGKNGRRKEEVLAEIEKCDILCANCHRIVHWETK